MTHCVYKRLLSFRYGDRLERAFFNAAPGCVDREYKQHVYYQSPNMQHIPHDYREYGRNVSDRFQMNESHQPPCCTGNQVCCALRQHSAAARLLTYKNPTIHIRTSCQRQIQTTPTCHCLPTLNSTPALLLVNARYQQPQQATACQRLIQTTPTCHCLQRLGAAIAKLHPPPMAHQRLRRWLGCGAVLAEHSHGPCWEEWRPRES
jgi:hypothetical protein